MVILKRSHPLIVAAFLLGTLFLTGAIGRADRLILKDGTILEGTIIRQSAGYWVKTADGSSRTVADAEVASLQRAGPTAATPGAHAPTTNTSIVVAKARASVVDNPLAGVAIWQQFVDQNPSSPDLDAAKEELARWKSLADSGAERISGKWIGGEELRQIHDRAAALAAESMEALRQNQTLKAIDKLKEAVKVYPNSFINFFVLGDLSLLAENLDEADKYYQAATKIRPDCSEVLNNLAIVRFKRRQFVPAMQTFETAAEAGDSKPLAQNLISAIVQMPLELQKDTRCKKAIETAHLLAQKYQVAGPMPSFLMLAPPRAESKTGGADQAFAWSGSGFFISDDGLILTNRHVVKGSKTLLVIMGDKQTSAEVVVIDDEQDLALIRIKTTDKIAFAHFAKADHPNDGADCVVMGYPLLDRLGADVKVTRGIVSSSASHDDFGADVLTDAKVNPGNSGGPILDHNGNVLAIVSMKSIATATEDSYGIGISAGHIRKFLEKSNIATTPGDPTAPALTTEQIAAQMKPLTVCILATKQ